MTVLWLKAFHIISFTAWFAGIFYIWRLFVYHSETNLPETRKTFEIMESKLYRIIMRPAMMVTVTLGVTLLVIRWDGLYSSYWIWIKITLVCLVIFQHYLADYYRKKLAQGIIYNSKKFRILNEIPTLLLILIVVLAVLKPI
ncbi:MAG: protoporphyrinogen oxidase HemJ [Leptospiraceae bacterium]|nr:protoporphyrinogen oxidase HemJ [Leptospiraceae bacterium]